MTKCRQPIIYFRVLSKFVDDNKIAIKIKADLLVISDWHNTYFIKHGKYT